MMNVMKSLKQAAFTAQWKVNEVAHPLQWLELEITRRCPLSCRHCGSSCGMGEAPVGELAFEELIGVCRRIADAYDPSKIKVAITGGEPFARPDLFHLIAHITEMGFRASIVTNGYLMRQEHLALLAAAGITSLSVSLDGLETTHDWVRGREGSFRRAIDAIRMLKQSGFFYVEPITTVNRRNLSELREMKPLLESLGVDGWRFGKTFPIGRATNDPELFLDAKGYRELLGFVKELRSHKDRIIRDVSFFEEGWFGSDELVYRDYFHQCPAGVNILTVRANGSVTGCAASDEAFNQGNVRETDVVELWESRFQVFRNRDWMYEGRCGECRARLTCRGDGFHLWKPGNKNPAICNARLYGLTSLSKTTTGKKSAI